MKTGQQSNLFKKTTHVTLKQRVIAFCILLLVVSVFAFLFAVSRGYIMPGFLLGVCGFKQRTGLPCPGCGITTSSIAFVEGRIIDSFYIQPAGAVLCITLMISGVFALLIAVFGVDFGIISKIKSLKVLRFVIIIAVIVFLGGWIVTLSRAISNQI